MDQESNLVKCKHEVEPKCLTLLYSVALSFRFPLQIVGCAVSIDLYQPGPSPEPWIFETSTSLVILCQRQAHLLDFS